MTSKLKRQWAALKRSSPGHRFQSRYEAAQRKENRASLGARIVRFTFAAAAITVGLVFVFIPGPAILFFALAGALLASESRAVARFLDWSEVTIRAIVRWGRRRWKKLPLAGKIAVSVVAVGISVAATYFSARMFMR